MQPVYILLPALSNTHFVYNPLYDVENRLLSASGPAAVTLSYDPMG